MNLRRLLLGAFLVPAMFMPGCKCIRTPGSVRTENAKDKKPVETAKVDEPTASPSASASPGGTVFDVEQRLEELRENFAGQRWEAVRHDATALVTANLDEVTKLEVLAMLLEALRNSGERDRAREIAEEFAKLYEKLKTSDKLAADAKSRDRINAVMTRVKAQAAVAADRFAEPEGEARLSFRLAEKLKSGGEDEVHDAPMADGGTIYYSKSPAALEAKAAGLGPDVAAAIQREPEFQYYFTIREAPLPANAPGMKKTP